MTLEQKINEGNPLCNQGWTACPTGAMGAFECVDTMSEPRFLVYDLWSCGGCNYAGIGGTDCSSIAGSDSVSCQVGKCVVESCRNNWTKTSQGTCAFNHARKR
ncbi:hypothetical protein BDY24DRAFT_368612 [Mrakia frigida]|uniref:uncharacterized protein n=1 Tax=Mrakia frigida TaxID=29902 RepID=UPI003FCBFCAE